MQKEQIDEIVAARHSALMGANGRSESAGTIPGQANPGARGRITALLDPDSTIEYGLLAGATTAPDDASTADGLIAAAGTCHGNAVLAAAFDVTVLGGSQSDRNLRKLTRLVYLANQHRWPLILILEGAGARDDDALPPPPILAQKRGRWDVLDGLAQLSGWAPTVAIVCGAVADGQAALAMLCDCVIATDDATFVSADSEQIHVPAQDYAKTGDLDLIATDIAAAIRAARDYLAFHLTEPGVGEADDSHATIADIIPDNRRRPYDMRRVIRAFADAATPFELGATWGRSMLTVLARLNGRTIGIFANQPKSPLAGAIDWCAADKAARFIDLCDAADFPLVSFVDNPGYMVGREAEADGIARHHPRPLSALHHRTVPLCTVQVRKAYGLGPYAMSGFGAGRNAPALKLAWPSVESGGMSLEGAAYLVKRKEILAAANQQEALAIRDTYAEKMRDAASGLRAGRAFSFDDIIEPRATRGTIGDLLARLPRERTPHKKHPIDTR